MSRNVAIRTDEQRRQYDSFLLRHCGVYDRTLQGQCKSHPPIFEMRHAELRQAALDELGFAPSRQYVYLAVRRLGIQSVRYGGSRAMALGRPATGVERWRQYRDRVRRDPEAEAAYLKRCRASDQKRRQMPKYREYNRKRAKAWRDKRRKERAAREPAMAGSPS